jgi:hypothetical protein
MLIAFGDKTLADLAFKDHQPTEDQATNFVVASDSIVATRRRGRLIMSVG